MELLHQTSHCFHTHEKHLSDLFDQEADIPRGLFSIIAIWESYYRFAPLFRIGMGE